MDHFWKTIGIIGLEILDICNGYPISYTAGDGGAATVPGVLLGVALLLVSVVCLAACACCRQNQRKGFKPDQEEKEKEKEFRDSTVSVHHAGLSFTNPGLTAGSELAIFPPPGVTFDPLPVTKRPTRVCRGIPVPLTEDDWFANGNLDFPRDQLQYLQECGKGWFGRVVEGEAKGKNDSRCKVMVRMLREDATPAEQKYFLNEAKVYRDLDHANVLKMVGRCLETNPYLVLLEACSGGDLKSFLRGNLSSSSGLCEQGVCLRIMCQVASGLQHMISHGFVHTDLAARNCQITSDLTVKVGDYGTSVDTYKEDYYIANDVAVPLRWCAPETLHCTDTTIETKQVTPEANVWSLGVVLWEICQFGQMPYSELSDDQVIVRVLGSEGLCLPPPTLHPLHASPLYRLMSLCWLPVGQRASLDHLLSMLTHLHSSHSEEDFQRRWDALRPNTITPEITLETMTARSDFDSGVDLEIKSTDRELLDSVKKSCSDVNISPSPQLSVASSSGGEFFSQTSLSALNKQLSPSLTNLRGSVEDVAKPVEQEKQEAVVSGTEEFDSWLKGVDTTNEEDIKFVKKISEAIKDLDDALALEKTSSSSDDSSRHESPQKDTNAQDENPVLDFRLGPQNQVRKQIDLQPDSLTDDSLARRDSSTDTEDETWRGRIERGEFSEKVKEKSKSVTDLMILTHIESESSESDSLPSLTRQYTVEKTKRKLSGAMISTIGFGSEGNIRGAVLGEEFQDALKQLQAEWKLRDMESRDNSLQFIKNEAQSSQQQQQDKLDFLANDASEQNIPHDLTVTKKPVVEESVSVLCSSNIAEPACEKNCLQGNLSPVIGKEEDVSSASKLPVEDDNQKINAIGNESPLSKLKISPETTDISDASQITESSSEISTPTQYEVVTVLDNIQSIIDGEKELNSSVINTVKVIKPVKSVDVVRDIDKSTSKHGLLKDILNTDTSLEEIDESNINVQIVPTVEVCPNSKIEHLKSDCDRIFNPINLSSNDITENYCLNIVDIDKCVNGEIKSDDFSNKLTELTINDLLSKSATQRESDDPSGNLVAMSSEIFDPTNSGEPVSTSHQDGKILPKKPEFLILSTEKDSSTFVPEIVVTEASILDMGSDSEPEIVLPNPRRGKRSVRLVVSDSEDEYDNITSDEFILESSIVTSTPFVSDRKLILTDDTVSDVDLTFPGSVQSESVFVHISQENRPKPANNEESSVVLGPFEDYTLDYFKGLKTTFGKQISDDSTDEFSKSEGEEDEKKQSPINNWDDFLTNSLNQRYQGNAGNCDVEFETSDTDVELNDKIIESRVNFNNLSDDNDDIVQPKINFNDDVRKDVMICERMNILEKLSPKHKFGDHNQQMQEVKSRLEDVAMLSENFCLKNQSISMDDDEDGKLLTPDDERSSDSGFRDKGSLSESVEDACDEKYNLEDIEAELEEQYGKPTETKSDEVNTSIDMKESDEEKCNDGTFIVSEQAAHEEADLTTSTIKPDSSSGSCKEFDEVACLQSESFDELERLNKLDNALHSDIDQYFETPKTKTGWYLHPPPGTTNDDPEPVASGWLPSAPEEGKDSSYVSFDIDEEFVTAIRNELREKLPCAQSAEKTDNEEDVSPEEERTDMVIQYNTFPVSLSPIFEERESISSNHSSLLLDDAGKSIESSGKSSPILYLAATKEDENLSRFEDDIRNSLDVCNSESTDSDNILVTVEDLENSRDGKAQKVVENTKEEMDDLLIVDTETNKVTLYESPRPRSQLAFVKQVVEPTDDSSPANSETYTFYHSADDNMLSVERNNLTYTPDSVSPLSSGSARTGIAVSFSSSETGGTLSGFYLSPSSVRSDLFDNGPPSLPFDLGQIYEPVEEIKPNNEAEEIVQELVEVGILKESDLTEESDLSSSVLNCGAVGSKETSTESSENVESESKEEQTETESSIDTSVSKIESTDSKDLSSITKGSFNSKALQVCNIPPTNDNEICSKIDELLGTPNAQVQTPQDSQIECNISDSKDWLKSVLLSNPSPLPETTESSKQEGVLVCLNSNGWPSAEELIPQPIPIVKCESQVAVTTPESPNMDLLEVAAKFYDVTSTLAISTPNNTSFDESKDNSQFSSFTSTPTLESAKCITSAKNTARTEESLKMETGKMKSIPTLSNLASDIVLQLPVGESFERKNTLSEDSSPDDSERSRRLQGLTLALEPSLVSKAPMPSPEDADKGAWRPTMGQLIELTSQPEQDDMMTTSFIDADNNDYAPDWESDSSDDSDEHSSSSGEFIWRDGDREEAVRVVIACNDLEPQEGTSDRSMARISEEEDDNDDDADDGSSCGSGAEAETEFTPSVWDSSATPTRSVLRSAEKQKREKRNVSFKRQKYHCVYEYPREPSDSEDEDMKILQRRTWQSPSTFDYSTYADWEYGEGEVEEAESDSDDNTNPRQLPESEYDFYRLSNLDFEMMTQMNLDEGEFFISSSARPFQGESSQFFPGSLSEEDFLGFQPSAQDLDEVVIPSPQQIMLDDTVSIHLKEVPKDETKEDKEKQKPADLFIVAEPLSDNSSSAEVSPTLGELRHTRPRLTLDLKRGGGVRGEASVLDSGGEDSGVESAATGSSDRLDQVQTSEA